jgi:phospholipase C
MPAKAVISLLALAALLAACSSSSNDKKSSPPPTGSTTAPQATIADLKKLEHIVVMMQENRSYDSYFGPLHDLGQPEASQEPTTGNPNPKDPTGPAIVPFHNPNFCETDDLAHGWTAVHKQANGGKMDGFTATNVTEADPTGKRTMAYYTDAELPYYYALAKTFGIADRYFASLLGATEPNRYFLVAGTSFGHINNALPQGNEWAQRTVFEELDEAHVSWRVYSTVSPTLLFKYVRDHADGHVVPTARYYTDAAAGKLPQVAFVDPEFFGDIQHESDEHPPANPQLGQKFTSGVINALMKSPNWPTSALFLTWDEHGGYYDHVVPPAAPIPDNHAQIGDPDDTKAKFNQYGIRVPALVVSPFSRPHFVSHVVHDHTSILRTIELRFGLPAMTRRDAQAAPMTEFLDFSNAAFATPPTLPAATVSPKGVTQCTQLHGGGEPPSEGG